MLLFSTVLSVNDKLKQDEFIRMMIEWNQTSAFAYNVIPGIKWNGEHRVKFGNDKVWMDIKEFRKENIMAMRYEKVDQRGIVWDTDCVLNMTEKKLSLRLDRSYLEESDMTNEDLMVPNIINELIDRGYLDKDGVLPVKATPYYVNKNTYHTAARAISEIHQNHLPIVYVSKPLLGKYTVDVNQLAFRLRGAAHILVQTTRGLSKKISDLIGRQIPTNGEIAIYYPNRHKKNQRLRRAKENEYRRADHIANAIFHYHRVQRVGPLYTWSGVSNELLMDKLAVRKGKMEEFREKEQEIMERLMHYRDDNEKAGQYIQELERLKKESDDFAELADSELKELEAKSKADTKTIEDLRNQLMLFESGFNKKQGAPDAVPILYSGKERDFYVGERKDLILGTLSKVLKTMDPNTRRYDVINDVIRANDYKATSEAKAAKVKQLISNYNGMTPKIRKELEDLGFQITHDKTHYKLQYYGDGRYYMVYGATPSDHRAGKNDAAVTIKKCF